MSAELVCSTEDRAVWLKARLTGITATDLPDDPPRCPSCGHRYDADCDCLCCEAPDGV